MNGRRYQPPAMRRKMAERMPEEEVGVDEEIDPMSMGSVASEMPTLTASAEMLKDAKEGDVVTFKVVSIDPETGDGVLSVATAES